MATERKRRRDAADDGENLQIAVATQVDNGDEESSERSIVLPPTKTQPPKNRFAYAIETYVCKHCPTEHTIDGTGERIAAHKKTTWLRMYMGRVMNNASHHCQINWEAVSDKFNLPQNGKGMPLCVVSFLRPIITASFFGHDHLMFILDAIIRHQNSSSSFEHAEMDVSIVDVLRAVRDSKLLSPDRFARFKLLFDTHLPILSLSSEEFKNCAGESILSVYRPWHNFKTDYLDNAAWPSGIELDRKQDDDDEE